jgi:endonuclease I
MKSKIILFFLIVSSFFLKAQIPPAYYQSTQGLNGIALKTALYNIIKGHVQYSYTEDTTDVWDILKQTDRDINDSAKVIEIYTGWSVNAAQEYNGGNGWEREHVWAKVHGGFDTYPPAGTDVHHIRPINGNVNGARNSRYFASCSTPYLYNGTPTGNYTSTSQWVWQPRNEDKGDIARMILYMATRYEGENGEPNLEIVDTIPSNNNDPSPIMAKLSDLLQWHIEDPVDNWEIRRNNIIYYNYQHNRNPFIDHPEYVDLIWGTSYISEYKPNPKIFIYPNPTSKFVNIQIPAESIKSPYSIIDKLGKKILNGLLTNIYSEIYIGNLTPDIYFINISNHIFKIIIY